MIRAIIAGDRNWADSELEFKIRSLLQQIPLDPTGRRIAEIVHGACYGVDLTADRIAREMGFTVWSFPADWNQYGRAAGPIRNKQMLDFAGQGQVVVYLFHKNIEQSKGTKNMMNQAKKKGVPVFLIK